MTVLVLGGTAEARALADALVARGTDLVSSLAGRVSNPRLPAGPVRIGGFGGADGLAEFIRGQGITAVVDATHPFSSTISANAASARAQTGVPLLRLARPGWEHLPQAGRWHWVDTHLEAAAVAASLGERVFLTTGRRTLDAFVPVLGSVIARLMEPAIEDAMLPEGWLVILGRGPYTLESERAVLGEHAVDVLVTKDSGGDYTRPKLDAADELGVEVVVVRRPAAPDGVTSVSSLDDALDWVARN